MTAHLPDYKEVKTHKHVLTPGLVKTLVKFYKACCAGNNEVNPATIGLSTTEYNNFQKLRYFGLVAKVKVAGIHKKGYWLTTHRGAEFLKNRISLPKYVYTRNNHLVDLEEFVSPVDLRGVLKHDADCWQVDFNSDPNKPYQLGFI